MPCTACQSWTLVPRPTPERQLAIHNDPNYFEHPYFRDRRTARRALEHRCRQAFRRIGRATDLASLRGQRLLDIGCDTGAFLRLAADEYGMHPVGIDVAGAAVRQANDDGIEAYETDLEHASADLSDFALVTAIDLLEHVTEPAALLREARRRLRPGGVLYIETPNVRSAIYRVGAVLCSVTGARPRPTFERLFPLQHIQYFTAEALAHLAGECDLEVVSVDARKLPASHIGTSTPVKMGLGALQLVDSVSHDWVLLCAVLRRASMSQTDVSIHAAAGAA